MEFKDLNSLVHELNNLSSDYDHIVKWDQIDFWENIETEQNNEQTALKIFYGSFRPYDEYIGYDGYGNIESMTEEEYHESLKALESELLEYLEEE